MRFQVRELLDRAVALVAAGLVCEAERQELIWTIVVFGVPHDGLLGHTDHVPGWDVGSIGEGEIFEDFALHGYYSQVRIWLDVGVQRCKNVRESNGS